MKTWIDLTDRAPFRFDLDRMREDLRRLENSEGRFWTSSSARKGGYAYSSCYPVAASANTGMWVARLQTLPLTRSACMCPST
jgi:hypothetical protein